MLELVHSKDYRPSKPRSIAKTIRLADEDRGLLKKAIKRLIKSEQLMWGSKHLVMKPDKSAVKGKPNSSKESRNDEVIGIYRRNSAGFGFVTPDDSTVSDRSEDIYVSKYKASDAADGDVVRVRTSRRRKGADVRTSGRVLEVIKRRTHRFVGTYHEKGGYGFVVVDNATFEWTSSSTFCSISFSSVM